MTWPLNDSEAGGDRALTHSLLLFCISSWAYANQVYNLHDKSRGQYQSKVTFSLVAIQNPVHGIDNCKMVFEILNTCSL